MASHAYHEKTESTWLLVWYHKLSDVQAFLMFAFWTVLEGFKFLHVCMCKYTLWCDHSDATIWQILIPRSGVTGIRLVGPGLHRHPHFNYRRSTYVTDELVLESLQMKWRTRHCCLFSSVALKRSVSHEAAGCSRPAILSRQPILRPTYPKIYIHMNQLV